MKMGVDTYLHDGLLMIWLEKRSVMDMISTLERKGINYVENVTWITLD
jgi:hypothetical protein